jgi:hypothetical protein
MQPRLTDLLRAVKPERALFTTFTLSLNWFESYCLPILKMEGCNQIDLLVDSREACRLGEETTSAYAGNAFRITSVYMNGSGIFHPKLAYLQGESDDTLVVGSGNLTHPGQGGSLEVIDAVNAQEHPAVFTEFAGFLELFMTRKGLSESTRLVLTQYAGRARMAASRASDEAHQAPRTVWLIHTLMKTAQEQFASLVRDHLRRPKTLTVLSPYHHAGGKALKKLADGCGTRSVRVGVNRMWNPALNDYSVFAPFREDAKDLPAGLKFVSPSVERSYPFSHAKCFEVQGSSGCIVMTGSVNATWQSLCETKNVEVSLARKLEASPFAWDESEPDVWHACEYDREHLTTPAYALQASWNDRCISGTLSPCPQADVVKLEIISRDTLEFFIDGVELAGDGSFAVETALTCATDTALRIRLRSSRLDVTGWLNVERELACPPFDRELSRSASNILRNKAMPADLQRILDQFRRILRHERALAQQAAAVATTASTTSVALPASRYDFWDDGEAVRLGISRRTAAQTLAAAFASLRETSRTSTAFVARGNETDETDAASPSVARKRARRPRLAAENPWLEMLRTLPTVLAVNASGPWMPALIALSAAQRLEKVNLDSEDEDARREAGEIAARRIQAWLTEFSRYDYSPENRAKVLPLFAGMAACAGAFAPHRVQASRLKQYLEGLAQRPLGDYEWLDLVDKALETEAFASLVPAERQQVLDTALALAEAPTTAQQLETLIENVLLKDASAATSATSPYAGVLERLLELKKHRLRSNGNRILFGVIRPDVRAFTPATRCPACNTPLGDNAAQLTQSGAAVHFPGCQKPVFAGITRESLSERGVPASLYLYPLY